MAGIGIAVDTTTWSVTNLMRLFIYTIAFAINVLELLFDTFTAAVQALLDALLPHTLNWYTRKAKAFQYGFNLAADTDVYDNTGYTTDQVAASKIIAYAATVEQTNSFGRIFLRLKVAATDGTNLNPITTDQLTAFAAYMARVKDAGVELQATSTAPDGIKQSWKIFFDPLILNANGNRLDGTSNTPVQDAIKAYLVNLPFNGVYDIQKHVDAVQDVQGVVSLELMQCQTQYGAYPYSNVDVFYTPDAGYLRFADDSYLTITFIPYNA
jgi:hypothetical protein